MNKQFCEMDFCEKNRFGCHTYATAFKVDGTEYEECTQCGAERKSDCEHEIDSDCLNTFVPGEGWREDAYFYCKHCKEEMTRPASTPIIDDGSPDPLTQETEYQAYLAGKSPDPKD